MNLNNPFSDIFTLLEEELFTKTVFDVFRFQYENITVYRQFSDSLKRNPGNVLKIEEIPFLPIEFFKTHQIITEGNKAEITFCSSGTGNNTKSLHFVKDKQVYEDSFHTAFRNFYGKPDDYCILALLPSYLEREGSSLVYMSNKLIELSRNPQSNFYLYEFEKLSETIKKLEASHQKTLLIGVSFALLDFAQQYPMPLKYTTIMETGGMKGRKEEITREKLHEMLCIAFQQKNIHSEYGMTELLSQAYSKEKGVFKSPPWMKILIRETNDPLSVGIINKTGGINIIDLANYNSCSFIATQDLGRKLPTGEFEVLGRFDHSDVRGCNLLTN